VSDEQSESLPLSEGVWARKRTVSGFAVAGFGVVERERGFGVAERIHGTADSNLEGEIGEMGSVSCAASLLDLYGIEVNDV
jgi:hypothetical protein